MGSLSLLGVHDVQSSTELMNMSNVRVVRAACGLQDVRVEWGLMECTSCDASFHVTKITTIGIADGDAVDGTSFQQQDRVG